LRTVVVDLGVSITALSAPVLYVLPETRVETPLGFGSILIRNGSVRKCQKPLWRSTTTPAVLKEMPRPYSGYRPAGVITNDYNRPFQS
jgi:hypothetical protein